MPAAIRPGEDNSELIELYDRLIDQWAVEMEHVVNVVGGSESREKYGGQLGPRFSPVSAARQREALRFLAENAFRTPRYLIDADVLRRIEPDAALRRVGSAQSRVLYVVMDTDRSTGCRSMMSCLVQLLLGAPVGCAGCPPRRP